MAADEKCRLCETRRPRRYCPGVRGDICAPCCGQEREVTVDCPLDCEYLREARTHEKPPDVNPDQFPNQDIRVSESFLRDNEALLLAMARALCTAAIETPGANDFDTREALGSLIRTYRTLQSGLYYESLPDNPLARVIHTRMQDDVRQYREQEAREKGVHQVRDAQVLGILAFLERLELSHNNGRRRGRAFIGFLLEYFAPATPPGASLAI